MTEEMMEEFEVGDVIALTEEGDDDPRDFRIMYIFEIEERTYFVLIPVDQEEEEEYEVHFLRYEGGDMLQPIEDDAEWEQVEAAFETLLADLEKEDGV
jgi:uncharacterized protein YrzB (UPF0473 family)